MTQVRHHHHGNHPGAHDAGCVHDAMSGHTVSKDSHRLAWALVIIAAFAVVEIVGGILSGSLALLADAGHMVTDGVAIALALWARHLAAAPSTAAMPYGRKRAQVLAAFVNGLALFVLIALLLGESVSRFSSPVDINAGTMLWVACIGLAANAAAFFILHSGDKDDINMRGALLHVVGDMLGSVAAIISAIVIATTGWVAIDPLVTILVCLLIGRSAFRLVKEAAHVLLQGAPKDLDVHQLRRDLLAGVDTLDGVHDLKVWMLTPGSAQLTMHATVKDIAHANEALSAAKAWLSAHHGIEESIIQIESTGPATAVPLAGEVTTIHACPDADAKQASARRNPFATAGLHQVG